LLPLHELADRWQELDAQQEIVVYCHHGHRSARAVDFLRRFGMEKVRNLAGGIDAWSKEIDPSVPLY
jgi:rhodanese-related sulfurtransferase